MFPVFQNVDSSVDESGTPYYNFTFLDQWMDWLQLYRLNPGFELMGNPSHLFSDFSNSTQAKMWRHLVREVASRYIGRLKRSIRILNQME